MKQPQTELRGEPRSLEFSQRAITHIQPPSAVRLLDFQEIWKYRELLYFLVWRDIKVRYKQTAIGIGWIVLQPLLVMVVFSIIFGKWVAVPTGHSPYPLFALVALLPWTFFGAAVSRASSSLLYDANLVAKVYFPRILLPFAAVMSNLVDFGVAFVLLCFAMAFFGTPIQTRMLALPLFLVLAVMAALAMSFWSAALNVKYRDVGYAMPFLLQLWLFASPVAYPTSIVPEQWRIWYALNPMVGVIEGFRWAVLGQQLAWNVVSLSGLVVCVAFLSGLFFFRHFESELADIV